jgi:predicted nuclease of predicted toxin-antitoxin system
MVRLYMDENVHGAITREVRKRGVDVLTVQEDGYGGRDDPDIVDRATSLGRVLFSQDEDLLAEATHRQRSGIAFTGLVFAAQGEVAIGQCVRDLELIAFAGTLEDFSDRVHYLPL